LTEGVPGARWRCILKNDPPKEKPGQRVAQKGGRGESKRTENRRKKVDRKPQGGEQRNEKYTRIVQLNEKRVGGRGGKEDEGGGGREV